MIPLPRLQDQPHLSVSPVKVVFATVLTLAAVYVFRSQFIHLDIAYIGQNLAQISGIQWTAAIALTAVSFHALGQYDVIWHRTLGTQVAPRHARRSGMAAIAIGQTVGFCAVTAGLIRWRALSGVDIGAVAKVSGAVAASFVTCWAILAIPAMWHLSVASQMVPPPFFVVAGLLVVIVATVARIAQKHGVPKTAGVALFWWTICDVTAAAGALYVLLPAGIDVPFGTLLAAYILALGAGIMSNAPAGIGVFDVVLISIIASTNTEPLLAAVLAFRLVYYIVPFVIGFVVTARPSKTVQYRPLYPIPHAARDGFLRHQAPAAWGLARQNGEIMRGRNLHFLIARVPCSIVALGDPLRTRADVDGHDQLHRHARDHGRLAVMYQTTARMAARARKSGWLVLPVARRAHLDPQSWTSSGAAKQGLRRKLSQAAKAGIDVTRVDPVNVGYTLATIAAAWSVQRGGQMGFSMGTFDRDYVASQAVYLIMHNDQPIGFVTFHLGLRSWALDLIRYTNALPQGAIHSAIVAAIADAKADQADHFCLAAAPYDRGWQGKLCKSRTGLSQFKQSFRPQWQTLYACAPNRYSMCVSAIAVICAIQRPLHKAFMWCAHGRKPQ